MCTVLFHRELGLLAKNREKTAPTQEELIQNAEYLAVKTVGASYFSLGLNKYGCAFVSTAVNTPRWTAAAACGDRDRASKYFSEENKGLHSPTALISERLAHTQSVKEWVDALVASSTPWMGYNVVVADKADAFVLELHGEKKHVRPLALKDVITNHFLHVAHGPMQAQDYPSSFNRLDYCKRAMIDVDRIDSLQNLLATSPADRDQQIWRFGNFATVSSTVLDLRNLCLWYKPNANAQYEPFRFA